MIGKVEKTEIVLKTVFGVLSSSVNDVVFNVVSASTTLTTACTVCIPCIF